MTGLILRIVLLPYVPVFSRWQTPDNRYRWPASGQGADIPVCFNLAGHNKYRAVFSFAVPDQNQGQSRLPIAVKFNLDQTGAAVVVIFLNLSSSWRSAKVTTFFPGYYLQLCAASRSEDRMHRLMAQQLRPGLIRIDSIPLQRLLEV